MARIPALLKWSLTSVLIGLHCSVPLHASSTENTANLLRIALPVSGWAMTRYYADQDGETQFYKSFAATVLSSYALKNTIHKSRPDGSDNDAFPSGHSAMAFQGATFIQRRYGNELGIPAYVLAAWTAQSRVNSDKQDYSDVLAGALIGFASSYYFTENSDLHVMPFVSQQGTGLALNYRW